VVGDPLLGNEIDAELRSQRNKKGGVDLSAFHATQGRRIVLLSQPCFVLLSQLIILRGLREGVRLLEKFLVFLTTASLPSDPAVFLQ